MLHTVWEPIQMTQIWPPSVYLIFSIPKTSVIGLLGPAKYGYLNPRPLYKRAKQILNFLSTLKLFELVLENNINLSCHNKFNYISIIWEMARNYNYFAEPDINWNERVGGKKLHKPHYNHWLIKRILQRLTTKQLTQTSSSNHAWVTGGGGVVGRRGSSQSIKVVPKLCVHILTLGRSCGE